MPTTSLWVSLVMVVVAVFCDVKTRRIPNLVTLGGLAAGLAIHGASGWVEAGGTGAAKGLGHALLGALACSVLPFVAWKRNEMGGGDVKLFAALGAILGMGLGFDVETKTFVLSFVFFLYRLVRHGFVRIVIANAMRTSGTPALPKPKLAPVIMGPTIGVAFALSMVAHGALEAIR